MPSNPQHQCIDTVSVFIPAAHAILLNMCLCLLQILSSNQAGSVAEIDIKANVCCAKYNPESMYKIAVGAADHTVHTYELRKADKAVHVFRGMRTPT